jgi:predicted HAD superfamily hydrolase
VRAPVDVFEAVRLAVLRQRVALLNHDRLASFTLQRIQAEREARELLVSSSGGEGEVQLDEIYDRYEALSGCDPQFRTLMQSTELRLEKLLLYASQTGFAKYNELRLKAGQIVFVSDMYLPSSWLSQMLADLGYEEAKSAPIFVSGEVRKSKHTGALYQEVRDRLHIAKNARWLHVGDNLKADIINARAHGLEAFHADWAVVDNRRTGSATTQSEYLVRSIVDFLVQPQARKFLPEEEYAAIGYRSFGPVIFGFMLWVLARAREAGLHKLAFIARDGWLPFQLFKTLKHAAGLGDVEESYVHFSRQAGLLQGIRSWDVDRGWPAGGRIKRRIDDALASVGLGLNDIPHVLERNGFKPGDEISSERYGSAVKLLVDSFEPILKMSLAKRQSYSPYFDSHFTPGIRTGFVDIGWNGNIQRYLIDSVDHRFSKDQFTGLFLGLHSTAKDNQARGLEMYGWLNDYGNPPHVQQYLQSGGVELLEFALTADHGTTLGFTLNEDGSVAPVLEELQPEEAIYRERAIKVQTGIRKFVEDYRFLLNEFDPAVICSTAWGLPFERLVTEPTPQEISLLADLSHSDGVGSTSSRLPLAARQDWKTRRIPGRRQRARDMAFWKAAFDRLNA